MQLQVVPTEIQPLPTAELDRTNDHVYDNVTLLVKAVLEMSAKVQAAVPDQYVAMVKVRDPVTFMFYFMNPNPNLQ